MLTPDIHENRVVQHAVREVRRALEACEDPEAAALLFELDAAVAQALVPDDVGRLTGLPGVPTATLAGRSALPHGVPGVAHAPSQPA